MHEVLNAKRSYRGYSAGMEGRKEIWAIRAGRVVMLLLWWWGGGQVLVMRQQLLVEGTIGAGGGKYS